MNNKEYKIGILTLPGNFNYGNRLQNYALEQVIINNFGAVNTLAIDNRNIIIKTISMLKQKKYEFSKPEISKQKRVKEKVFSPFTRDYLNNKKEKVFSHYDYVIVGSDQVWNPNFMKRTDRTKWFLDFVPKEKRISYAASFGVSEIPDNLHSFFKEGLTNMNYISVREEAGIEIVKNISNRDAELVVDPTMLLTLSEWNELIARKKNSSVDRSDKFIIVYMLREFSHDRKLAVENFAKKNNFKIIQIMGDTYHRDHVVYDPIEFIESIKYAQMVFTDSFHCTVFSILFKTPFCVFDRVGGNMGSRLQTLLKKFSLVKNQYVDEDRTDIQALFKQTAFNEIDSILEEGRQKGIEFLKESIK